MRIAYILTALRDLSSVHVALDQVNAMMQHGHACKVFYFKEIKEVVFPCPTEKISLFKSIPFNQFDIIHTHCFRPDLYAFLHKPFFGKKPYFVNTIHSYLYPDYRNSMGFFKGSIIAFLELLFMRRIDKNVCMSNTAVEYYSRYLCKEHLTYSYNTKVIDNTQSISEHDKFTLLEFKSKHIHVCGSICVVSPIKGLDQVIKALPALPRFGFVIIGDGPSVVELKQLASDLHVDDQVLFLGFRKDGYRFIPYLDIFCMPSHSEGCPVAMLEAAAMGKPIVTTDIPIFKELLSSTECVQFQENDIEDCAKAIEKAVLQSAKLGANAKAKFDSHFSFESFYRRYLSIYKRDC